MESPYASSHTLSIHSDEDEEFTIPPTLEDAPSAGEEDFVLPEEYTLQAALHSFSAPMRAAMHPDPRFLKALLSAHSAALANHFQENADVMLACGVAFAADLNNAFGPNSIRVSAGGEVGITTPLLAAIRSSLPENVKTLLEAGALPSGVPLPVMENYAAFFLRFRPRIPLRSDEVVDVASRGELLKLMDLHQISTLTWEEVEDRMCEGMAPFWCEEGFTPRDFYPHGGTMLSLVEAAKSGSIEIFDQLLAAGADASFWMSAQGRVPEPPTESSLGVSSPLHAAIESKNTPMLKHLLDLGFDPNTLPLSNPTRCYTPLMATIISCDPFNKEAFDVLATHKSIDFSIRTPVYSVHLLYFAVAKLDLEMLKYVSSKVHLCNAGTTALHHTLLHIACMPSDSMQVQRHSQVIYNSIHETRDLSPWNDPHVAFPPQHDHPIEFYERDFEKQSEVVRYLCDKSACDLMARDIHGNTALHYLAGVQSVNWSLVQRFFEGNGGRVGFEIWHETRNNVGATPNELSAESERVRGEEGMGLSFPKVGDWRSYTWKPWFGRHGVKDRVERKEAIWALLLGGTVVAGSDH
jgi:ankyrin repeat protein